MCNFILRLNKCMFFDMSENGRQSVALILLYYTVWEEARICSLEVEEFLKDLPDLGFPRHYNRQAKYQ